MPHRSRLALTLGDPNGIGPEVVLKTLADGDLRARIDPVLVGSEAVLHAHAARLGLEDVATGLDIWEVAPGETPDIAWGETNAVGGRLAMRAVERAVDACLAGEADAMVTAPISKEAITLAGYHVPGHTEFIAARTDADGVVMVLLDPHVPGLRVALVTTHMPVRAVADAVTPEVILDTLRRLDASLRRDFGIDAPRVAVLGLNPHAGDGGVIGTEDRDLVEPALERARAEGLGVHGPFPADAFFGRRGFERHDAVLAMYHDQGLAPFKALAMGGGVNVSVGLPIVRTSPDHGTGFDIAGRGLADAASFREATLLAAEIAARRRLEDRG
ncbi:MAG: 4-hydroxythreonine-4-phosphate dehydrogenase PdxA [Bacteroidota bacterium]